ncbi:hypothetical protein [Tessaracoccus sp. OH4464_COT-324]|uniref:hypothetical protein n=1 Tax=Tessaracoccus sp. OH4464_COT-324 TaxID=2491059 RepID=UPI000F63D0FF|nr:hypothetical protein [Tessaracoccus sp. OH4464_COT-324]RRD47209.1 hypothetical protein EII42_04300 [Tessaracoccus sp. OH4464_COT-324]
MSGGTIRFHPESWEKGSRAIAQDAEAFAKRAESAFAGMTSQRLGCDGNGTMMDAAFAIVFPVAVEAFRETAAGLAEGFDAVSDGMSATAEAYRAAAEYAEQVALKVGS